MLSHWYKFHYTEFVNHIGLDSGFSSDRRQAIFVTIIVFHEAAPKQYYIKWLSYDVTIFGGQ